MRYAQGSRVKRARRAEEAVEETGDARRNTQGNLGGDLTWGGRGWIRRIRSDTKLGVGTGASMLDGQTDGYVGAETGDTQVGGGSCGCDKLWIRVGVGMGAGE